MLYLTLHKDQPFRVVEKVRKCVEDMEENSKARLLDGFYKCTENIFEHWEVRGDKIDIRDPLDCYDPRPVIEYGDFGGFNTINQPLNSTMG